MTEIKKYIGIRRDSNLNEGGVMCARPPDNPISSFPMSIPIVTKYCIDEFVNKFFYLISIIKDHQDG
ncbi:hypothetical protein CVS40_3385 [Lucilia cuprina]|nr:hypothetical protein CVS40_3385 [Lucilia cuprina]